MHIVSMYFPQMCTVEIFLSKHQVTISTCKTCCHTKAKNHGSWETLGNSFAKTAHFQLERFEGCHGSRKLER